MLDGILWSTVKQRPQYDRDGYLTWIVLERNRITGVYRTTLVDEKWNETHARRYAKNSEEVPEP